MNKAKKEGSMDIKNIKNLHPTFEIAIRKSNDFKRPISVYKTKTGQLVNLYIYPGPENPWFAIIIHKSSDEVSLEESYNCYFKTAECQINLFGHIRSATGLEWHNFRETGEKQPVKASEHVVNPNWLISQLNIITGWLEDPSTVRVNPYHPEQILDGEETEIDQFLGGATTYLDRLRCNWAVTPLKPGINKLPEDGPISFN